uniref:Diacylglycerol kinase n=1 Tax=Rhodotorula toruloides TaxID=5286 RepID=A0A2Z6EYU8_RHOTO|nr:diacylglycerol kinase [Rhodotorula toruloides]
MSQLRQRARNGQSTAEDKVAQKPLKAPEVIAADGDRVDRGRWRSGLEVCCALLVPSSAASSSPSPPDPPSPELTLTKFYLLYLWLSHPNVPTLLRYLAYATAVIATADVLRFRFAWFERAYEGLLGYFMRESERHAVNGTIYYLVGVLWCLSLYPRDIACLSIIMLSLCDTSASVFGRLFGRYTPRLPFSGTLFGAKKSLAGTLAAIGMGMAASHVFWSRFAQRGDEGDVSWVAARVASGWSGRVNRDPLGHWGIRRLPNPNSTLDLHTLVVVNGLTAGLAEAIDFFGFDDNLSLPVLFGFFCWLSMYILG